MLLADLGAEVIKVERPGSGDDTRAWGPPYDATRPVDLLRRGQPQQAVDRDRPRRHPTGSLTPGARRRRPTCSSRTSGPGLLDGLGLGYDDLTVGQPRPDLLLDHRVRRHGRGAALPGYDLLVQAIGGLMSITGEPGGEPQKVGVALVDVLAGLFATVGILAALNHRHATGEGQLDRG